MAKIEDLTYAANLQPEMMIPVSLFGQNMRISVAQLSALSGGTDTRMRYSADGEHWHDTYDKANDTWVQISTDGGKTWGPAINMSEPDSQPIVRDGKTLYTWLKFSSVTNPVLPEEIYDEADETTVAMGWAYNKESKAESTNPADYEWIAIPKGGAATVITGVVEFYAIHNSGDVAPTTGWVEVPAHQMPVQTAQKPYLWSKERTYYENGPAEYKETNARCLGKRGEDGSVIIEVVNYYLASKRYANVTRKDTADDIWDTNPEVAQALFSSERPYMWNYEVTKYSGGRTIIIEPHIIGVCGTPGQNRFPSSVFCRSCVRPATPTGGSYDNPLPVEKVWSDGIPAGEPTLPVWMSRRMFTSDGQPPQESAWSTPQKQISTFSHAIRFADGESEPAAIADGTPPDGLASVWKETPTTSTVWRAECYMTDGTWGKWSVMRVKGEKGDKGDKGADAFYLDLDNEMDSIPCFSDGTVRPSVSYPSTNATVYRGTSADTGWTFSIKCDGCTASVSGSKITVNSITKDRASVNVTATKTGHSDLKAVMTVVKVCGGLDAKVYSIKPNVNVIRKSKDGIMSPASVRADVTSTQGDKLHKVESYGTVKYAVNDGAETALAYSSLVGRTEAVAVTASTTSVTFLLYDNSGVLLDRERVPVVSDGTDGKDGKDGRGISDVGEEYALGTSDTNPPENGWSTAPATPTKALPYLWNREVIHFDDGSNKVKSAHVVCMWSEGLEGASIDTITNYYLASAKSTGVKSTDTGWTTTPQTLTKEKPYLWNYEKVTYTRGKTATETTPAVIGTLGKDGADGKDMTYEDFVNGGGIDAMAGNLTLQQAVMGGLEKKSPITVRFSPTPVVVAGNSAATRIVTLSAYNDAKMTGLTGTYAVKSTTGGVTASISGNNLTVNIPANTDEGTVTVDFTPSTLGNGSHGVATLSIARAKTGTPGKDAVQLERYVMYPDVTRILVKPDGTLAQNTITVSVFKDTGKSMAADSSCTVYYKREGIDSAFKSVSYNISAGLGNTATISGLTASCTAVKLELRNSGNTVVATETVIIGGLKVSDCRNEITIALKNDNEFVEATKGKDGESATVESTKREYQRSASGVTEPTGTWLTTVPAATAAAPYIWTRTTTTYNNGKTAVLVGVSYTPVITFDKATQKLNIDGKVVSDSLKGTDANNPSIKNGIWYIGDENTNVKAEGTDGKSVSITKTEITYASSASGTVAPTAGWSTSIPSVAAGQYLWTRRIVTYNNGTSTTDYSAVRQGINGIDGKTWKPNVDTNGNVSWSISTSTATPSVVNIKGAPGARGKSVITLTVPSNNTSYYPYGATLANWEKWSSPSFASDQNNWLAGNVADISVGDTVVVRGKITDMNDTPCSLYGTVQKIASGYVYISGFNLIFGRTGKTWRPAVDSSGNLTWSESSSPAAPSSVNIKGHGIVASVSRDAFTEAQWTTYGTINHEENWANTSGIRNGCRVGDLFTVVGTSTDGGRAHTLTYRSTTASGDLHGVCISHVVANRGIKGDTFRPKIDASGNLSFEKSTDTSATGTLATVATKANIASLEEATASMIENTRISLGNRIDQKPSLSDVKKLKIVLGSDNNLQLADTASSDTSIKAIADKLKEHHGFVYKNAAGGFQVCEQATCQIVDFGDSSHTHSYLPLTGGKLTGPLIVDEIDSTTGVGLLGYKKTFTGTDGTGWSVGANDCVGVIRSSNASLKHYRNGVGASTIWDSGNDGSGSGLDADLLDGKHASAFATSSHTHSFLPLSGGTLTSATRAIVNFNGNDDGNYIVFNNKAHFGLYAQGTFIQHSYGGQNDVLELTNDHKLKYKGSVVWHAGNDGADSGLDADTLDGYQAANFTAARVRAHCSVSGTRANITTAQFIDKLKALGCFNFAAWNMKATWAYANNDNITDTGLGTIHLAGAVIEVFGNAGEYTVRVTTAPTSVDSGVTNAVFIYNNHGTVFKPKWTRLSDTAHTHSQYFTTITGQSTINEISAIVVGVNPSGQSISVLTKPISAFDGLIAPKSHSHSYLPLSGGMITSTTRGCLTLKGADGGNFIYYGRGDKIAGAIGAGPTGVFMQNSLATGTPWVGIKDDGNLVFSKSGTEYNVWHAGNDGTGSGLDADTLDGYHAESFPKWLYCRSDQNSIYSMRKNWGIVNKGDYNGTHAAEYPVKYGSYVSAVYSDKNMGSIFMIDAWDDPGRIWVTARKAGDNNTTFGAWRKVAFTDDAVKSHSHSSLQVSDVRGTNRLPSYFSHKTVTPFFNETGMPSANWYSGLNVKGWTDTYLSWQIVSLAAEGDDSSSLFFRNGRNSSWQAWRTILDSQNFGTYAAAKSHSHSNYATTSHTHSSYLNGFIGQSLATDPDKIVVDVSQSGQKVSVSTKPISYFDDKYAAKSHSHSNYATTNHAHSNYLQNTQAVVPLYMAQVYFQNSGAGMYPMGGCRTPTRCKVTPSLVAAGHYRMTIGNLAVPANSMRVTLTNAVHTTFNAARSQINLSFVLLNSSGATIANMTETVAHIDIFATDASGALTSRDFRAQVSVDFLAGQAL